MCGAGGEGRHAELRPADSRGVLHHLHAAVLPFRAVENRIPFARADTNGAPQVIDGRGRILGQSRLFASDALVADVPPGNSCGTPFTRWGDWMVYGAMLVALVSFVRRR